MYGSMVDREVDNNWEGAVMIGSKSGCGIWFVRTREVFGPYIVMDDR